MVPLQIMGCDGFTVIISSSSSSSSTTLGPVLSRRERVSPCLLWQEIDQLDEDEADQLEGETHEQPAFNCNKYVERGFDWVHQSRLLHDRQNPSNCCLLIHRETGPKAHHQKQNPNVCHQHHVEGALLHDDNPDATKLSKAKTTTKHKPSRAKVDDEVGRSAGYRDPAFREAGSTPWVPGVRNNDKIRTFMGFSTMFKFWQCWGTLLCERKLAIGILPTGKCVSGSSYW